MGEIAIRRVGVLLVLSILFITINMFVVLMFNSLIGEDYGSWWYAFSIAVLVLSAIGSIYAVFMVYNYEPTKAPSPAKPKMGFLPERRRSR